MARVEESIIGNRYGGLLSTVVASGELDGYSIVHKFGRNTAVGTSFVPICIGGVYRTPQVSAASALRVKAGNANDTAAGTGAREVMVQGLGPTGAEQIVALATNGTSAGAASTETFIRTYRKWVSKSGTYADQTTGSHAANIVVENAAGTEDWISIDATDYPRGQSECGFYTVPLGKTAYINLIIVSVASTKTASLVLFQRQNILEAAAPYSAMRVVIELGGITGQQVIEPDVPIGPFPALTDIGFLGKVTQTTGEVVVDFELLLVDE